MHAQLADFGLARRIPTSETRFDAGPVRVQTLFQIVGIRDVFLTTGNLDISQLAPGSPNYMAPELFEQPAIHSFASDFWALVTKNRIVATHLARYERLLTLRIRSCTGLRAVRDGYRKTSFHAHCIF
jgi:serine/threonine protein kinase